MTIEAQAGITYYFQAWNLDAYYAIVDFSLRVASPPSVYIYHEPYDPSVFDNIYFYSNVYDEANLFVVSYYWDMGDGTISTDGYVQHRYAGDGDYTVHLEVTMSDGRTASTSQVVQVRTHDVAIVKLERPVSANVGQTKKLVISVSNARMPENVTVELQKSVPGGFQNVGSLTQYVAAGPRGEITKFYLSYTFTPDDAKVGKVTFKAIAWLNNARDALPADNEFISYPVVVKSGAKAASFDEDDMSDYVSDTVSNVEQHTPAASPAPSSFDKKNYLPIITH